MLESTIFFVCFVISQINELHVSISPWNGGRKVCSLYFMNINQLDCYDHLDKKHTHTQKQHSCLLNARTLK